MIVSWTNRQTIRLREHRTRKAVIKTPAHERKKKKGTAGGGRSSEQTFGRFSAVVILVFFTRAYTIVVLLYAEKNKPRECFNQDFKTPKHESMARVGR